MFAPGLAIQVQMTPNILIEDAVIIALLTKSLHVSVIEETAAFRLDGAMLTDKCLIGYRCK